MATCDFCLDQSIGRGLVNQEYLYLCKNHYFAYYTSMIGWEFTNLGRNVQAD